MVLGEAPMPPKWAGFVPKHVSVFLIGKTISIQQSYDRILSKWNQKDFSLAMFQP